MRYLAILIGLLVATGVGCKRATDPADPAPAPLVLTRVSDYQGHVTRVITWCGGFTTPVGWPPNDGCEYNVWYATPPNTAADAGVIVGDSVPVFIGAPGSYYASTPSAIGVGDMIQIWTDGATVWGAVNCPPGTPCYGANQIVIVR